MTFGVLALTVAALFTGAASYVSFVEHPARAMLDDRAQLEEWKPAYARGAVMQASLAAIGFGLGAAAWWMTGDLRWLVGGLILLAGWPYTLLIIMPTNRVAQGHRAQCGQRHFAGAARTLGPASCRAYGAWRRRNGGLRMGRDCLTSRGIPYEGTTLDRSPAHWQGAAFWPTVVARGGGCRS